MDRSAAVAAIHSLTEAVGDGENVRTLRGNSAPAGSWIGRPIKRVEDARLLTGRGTFINDHPPVANACHAAIVRSPHAHARILGYDVSQALAMPGVVGVITGQDVAK